jgi:hypothetical protein
MPSVAPGRMNFLFVGSERDGYAAITYNPPSCLTYTRFLTRRSTLDAGLRTVTNGLGR